MLIQQLFWRIIRHAWHGQSQACNDKIRNWSLIRRQVHFHSDQHQYAFKYQLTVYKR